MPRELPCFEISRWNSGSGGQRGPETLDFVIKEKESLVLDDWTADGITKLITHVRILLFHRAGQRIGIVVEPISCAAKRIPPSKPVGIAMKTIGPALRYYINDSAGISSILRRERVRYDAEFFGGFRIRSQGSAQNSWDRRVIVIYAIEQEVVVAIARAVYREPAVA